MRGDRETKRQKAVGRTVWLRGKVGLSIVGKMAEQSGVVTRKHKEPKWK